jgi:hypothetical protein
MGALLYRAMGASVFDGGTFEVIEADRKATVQAVIVVLASSLAGAIGASVSLQPRFLFIAIFVGVAVTAWLCWLQLILLVGSHQFREPATRVDFGELVRTTGFASAPGILQLLAVIPSIAAPVFVLTWIWMLAAMVLAVKHALDIRSTWRAVMVCGAALGLILALVVAMTRALSGRVL